MAGGGIGEAVLLSAATGAAMGGAGAALSGRDPLEGILTGGLLGGATGGLGGVLGGQAAGTGAMAAAPASVGPITANAAQPLANMVATSAIPNSIAGSAALGAAAPGAVAGVPNVGLWDVFSPGNTPGLADMGFGERLGNYIVQNPVSAGMGASTVGGMLMGGPQGTNPDDEERRKRYSGPLSYFSYDPQSFRPSFAQGGIASLPATQRYLGGGHIEGPGDGLSDEVPAMIEGSQPAALSDGEFVVPADVVSGLGNGSTDAGAKQLYDLIARVRQQRTGQTRQAPAVRPDVLMGMV